MKIQDYNALLDSVGGISALKPAQKEAHEMLSDISDNFTSQSQMDEFLLDATIKETIDIYINQLNSMSKPVSKPKITRIMEQNPNIMVVRPIPLPKEKTEVKKAEPKAVKKPAPKPVENRVKTAEKPEKAVKKATKKEKVVKPKVSGGELKYGDDVKIVRGFLAMVNGAQNRTKLINFYKRFNKQNAEKRFQDSKLKNELRKIVELLSDTINNGKYSIKPSPEFVAELLAIREKNQLAASVQVLKRFFNFIGESAAHKQVDLLLNAADKISSEDKYYKHVERVVYRLNQYKQGKTKTVEIDKPSIDGLSGVLSECGCRITEGTWESFQKKNTDLEKHPPIEALNLHVPAKADRKKLESIYPDEIQEAEIEEIQQNTNVLQGLGSLGELFAPSTNKVKHKEFRVKGEIGKFLGLMELYRLVIILHGERGGGKSHMMYDLINAFAELPFINRIALFSLEEGNESSLVDRKKEIYFGPEAHGKVVTAGEAPEGINTIELAAKHFDVIAIDSFGKLNAPQSELDRLRRAYPNTIFIFVFQSTTNGTARGGSAAGFDCSIELIVFKANGGFNHHYCFSEKNRYGEAYLKYNFNERKLISDEKNPSQEL